MELSMSTRSPKEYGKAGPFEIADATADFKKSIAVNVSLHLRNVSIEASFRRKGPISSVEKLPVKATLKSVEGDAQSLPEAREISRPDKSLLKNLKALSSPLLQQKQTFILTGFQTLHDKTQAPPVGKGII